MVRAQQKKRAIRRKWTQPSANICKQETKKKRNYKEILDFLPPEIIRILEESEHKFSHSEQIMITLFAQIIVEIALKEDI